MYHHKLCLVVILRHTVTCGSLGFCAPFENSFIAGFPPSDYATSFLSRHYLVVYIILFLLVSDDIQKNTL